MRILFCAGSCGRGVRPLIRVKQTLVRQNILLPRCSGKHWPKPYRPVDSMKIVDPQLAPTAGSCRMCAGAQGTKCSRLCALAALKREDVLDLLQTCVKLGGSMIVAREQYLRKNIVPPRSARPNDASHPMMRCLKEQACSTSATRRDAAAS